MRTRSRDITVITTAVSKMQILYVLFITIFGVAIADVTRYDGYKVYRVTPLNTEQGELLKILEGNPEYDFWNDLHRPGLPSDIMVSPTEQRFFEELLYHHGIPSELLIEDVERVFENERADLLRAPRIEKGRISFDQYHRYDQIVSYLTEISLRYSNVSRLIQYGVSTEGRPLYGLVISSVGTAFSKPLIFIDGGIHAREWIAPALALYIIQELLENPNNAEMVENADWFIAPVLNPDGYEFTFTNTRLWRKTRGVGEVCIGVDANRNWDYEWLGLGASDLECSQIYAGPVAFSEPENLLVSQAFLRYQNATKLYLSIHSYGNYIIYPWSYTLDRADDFEEMDALARDAADAIFAVNGTTYRTGQSSSLLYYAAGCSSDWFKGAAGVELAFVYELPGGGNFGFDLPASSIQPVLNETWPSVVVFYNHVVEKFGGVPSTK